MGEEEKEEKKTFQDIVKEKSEKKINELLQQGIKREDVDYLYKVIDIHKDMLEEEYYEAKKEEINMNSYGNYFGYGDNSYGRRGVPGTGRRYGTNGSYGRRGVDTKYRGEQMLDDMHESYQAYSEGKEIYGTDQDTMKALQYMLKLDKKFIQMLEQDAKTPEEEELIRQHKMEMAEM